MARKPLVAPEYREVAYSAQRWILLEDLRAKATQIMEALCKAHLDAVVHGSIARGDVTPKSDVDVFVPSRTSSFSLETALENAGYSRSKRFIVQATPTYAMKAYVEIDDKTRVSFPLMSMRKVEQEFYKFGGEASLVDLRSGLRLIGVNKQLMLIEPTAEGHKESAIVGREEQAAKLLEISAETVLNRTHALLRRDKIGRTGVFIQRELREDETFEMALRQLADQNPAVRRRLRSVT